MARKAHVTHIQTGSERTTGKPGYRHNDETADTTPALTDEEVARGDKVYGPGAPDGMPPRGLRGWLRR